MITLHGHPLPENCTHCPKAPTAGLDEFCQECPVQLIVDLKARDTMFHLPHAVSPERASKYSAWLKVVGAIR